MREVTLKLLHTMYLWDSNPKQANPGPRFPSWFLHSISTLKAQKATLMPKQPVRHIDMEMSSILVRPSIR